MADFRSVQTRMWREDVWFEQLPDNDARLLWVYLFTNPSSPMTGLYRLTLRSIANETYISQEKTAELLEMFARDGKAYYDQERGVIFVVNMQRLQFENVSPNMARRMQKDIDAIPDCELKQTYLTKYGYPMIIEYMDGSKKRERVEYRYPWDDDKQGSDNLSIPYGYPIDRGATTETETETETVTGTASAAAELTDEQVDEFRTQYENVMGLMSTAIYPNAHEYMAKLVERGASDWWTLALRETVSKADRPGWQYMKAVLEGWLAAGHPSTYTNGKTAADAPAVPVKIGIIWPDGTTGEVETTKRV